MRRTRRPSLAVPHWLRVLPIVFAAVVASATIAAAQTPSLEALITAVVKIKTHINPEGTTVRSLGRDRDGTGIVIDSDGLVLTIGYLMTEAYAAEVITNDGRTVPASVVGYDHESGLGLLRTIEPLKVKPLPFGKAADVKEIVGYLAAPPPATVLALLAEEIKSDAALTKAVAKAVSRSS